MLTTIAPYALAYAAILVLTLGWFAVGARGDHITGPSGVAAGAGVNAPPPQIGRTPFHATEVPHG